MIAIAIFSMRGSICRNDLRPGGSNRTVYWASIEKRRSETSCLVVKEIRRCVPSQSTLVSRLMPPKSRAHVFFDIGNSSHFRDVHLIGGLNFVSRMCQFVFDKARNTTISRKLHPPVLLKRGDPPSNNNISLYKRTSSIQIYEFSRGISTSFQIEYRERW